MRNRDRVAVVTGASAGVGRATVLRLARAGWHIGLIARGAEPLEALAREVRALGAEALPLPCDVADAAAVEAAAGEGAAGGGRARARPDRRLDQQRHGHALRPDP
ncbi:SDR family NAD(P)-dependent oxidoreductase [Teichococcus aerofrigidensis]